MIRIADLFAGGGGVSAGAHAAGLNVVFAANHWREAVALHASRHPDAEHVCQDLNQYDFRAMPDHDILWASPACQGHSEAAQPARSRDASVTMAHDHLRTTAWAVITAVMAKMPRAFVVENVPEFREWRPPGVVVEECSTKLEAQARAAALSLATSEHEHTVTQAGTLWRVVRWMPKGCLYRHWLMTFALAGYRVTEQVLLASRWEVPQRRSRLILVGHLDSEVVIDEPAIARVDEPTLRPILDPSAGPWIDIEDITRPGARARARRAHDVFGGEPCWGYHVSHRGGWARSLDQASTTVTTQNHHYLVADGQYRLWSVPETAQVMGFEADYFDGVGRTAALKMAGNAVPPPMACGILRQVASAL